jgi:hypothetical protein
MSKIIHFVKALLRDPYGTGKRFKPNNDGNERHVKIDQTSGKCQKCTKILNYMCYSPSILVVHHILYKQGKLKRRVWQPNPLNPITV